MNSALMDPPTADRGTRERGVPTRADHLGACELNARVNPHDARSFTELADLLETEGDAARAARLRGIAARLARRAR